VSPPTRSHQAMAGLRSMETGSRQRARAVMIMVVAHLPEHISTSRTPAPVRHAKSPAHIVARKCRHCWMATSATIDLEIEKIDSHSVF
jgi:hypothetical protein